MSQQSLPNPGTYLARRTGLMAIIESDEGAILVYIPYALCAQGVEFLGKHMLVLFKKDGSEMASAKRNLMKAFGWDGIDLGALQSIPLKQGEEALLPEFELADCYHDNSYTPPGAQEPIWQFKAQWFNALGGTQNMPEQADADTIKKLMAKFGSKLKASSAGASGQRPAASNAQPASKPGAPAAPKSKGPPSRGNATSATPRTSSLDEVWNWVCTKNAGKDEGTLGSLFYGPQEELFPGRDYEANPLNPQEWGQVADKLGM